MGASDPTAELCAVLDVARTLHADESDSARKTERRQLPRLAFERRVRIYVVGPTGTVQCSFDATARDVGQDGMAVECSHLMHDGTQAWIEFEHPDGSPLVFFARVRYCIHEGRSTHRVGFEFSRAPATVEPLAA